MKEFICKEDFYIEDCKFSSVGDRVTLLQDNTTVVNRTNNNNATQLPEIVNDMKHFLAVSEDPKSYDSVSNPKHYTSGDIACIDAMIAAYGVAAVMYFCQCNAFKYQWRFDKKDDWIKDLKKAQWYQNKYIELKNGIKNNR